MPTAAVPARVARAATESERRLVKLADLANRTGRLMYDRARLAAELLADREWLRAAHDGDEGAAADWLQDNHFADLIAPLTVVSLTGMYRDLPEPDWVAAGWNVKALLLKWQDTKRPRPQGQPAGPAGTRNSVKVKEHEALRQEKEEVEFALRRERDHTRKVTDEAGAMRARVRELELENAALRGRVAELEVIVERLMKDRGVA
jgi:hypothetical protein